MMVESEKIQNIIDRIAKDTYEIMTNKKVYGHQQEKTFEIRGKKCRYKYQIGAED